MSETENLGHLSSRGRRCSRSRRSGSRGSRRHFIQITTWN